MRRLSIILFCLLFAVSAAAQIVVVAKKKAAAGCSESTDEVGDRTAEAGGNARSADSAWGFLATADCKGTLKTAYLYFNHDVAANAKVCLYSTAGSAETPNNAGNLLLECSDPIASGSSAGWKSIALAGTTEVTQGTSYWILFAVESGGNTWTDKHGATASSFYQGTSGIYASPPANLNGKLSNTAATSAPISMYMTIGE